MFLSQVKSSASAAYSGLPSIASPVQMASNLKKVAIPALAFLGSYLVKRVDAFGCIACAVCLLAPGPHCILPCVICGVTIPIPVGIMPGIHNATKFLQ